MNNVQEIFETYKLKSEMPFYQQLIWKVFGKKMSGFNESYYGEGYKFRGITLITKVKYK